MGNQPDALSVLRKAQQIDRQIAKITDLQYEYFWGPKAVAALQNDARLRLTCIMAISSLLLF